LIICLDIFEESAFIVVNHSPKGDGVIRKGCPFFLPKFGGSWQLASLARALPWL
jgi:hypothetical protein